MKPPRPRPRPGPAKSRPDAPRPGADAPRPRAAALLERHGSLLVIAMVAIHAGIFTGLAAYKLRHYLYTDFDLAIFAHAVSQALRGSLDESIGGMRWLGGHVAPVLFLLAPLWAV